MSFDGTPIVARMTEELEAVVDRYRDQGIGLAEVVGALEILKSGLIHERWHLHDPDPLDPLGH